MCAWVMNSALLYGSQQMGIIEVCIEIRIEYFQTKDEAPHRIHAVGFSQFSIL